jgi:vacuolar-type H+-ATPase subunit I/STV1
MPSAKPRVAYSHDHKPKLEELAKALNMSMGEAVDWLIENSHQITRSSDVAALELEPSCFGYEYSHPKTDGQYSVAEQKEINDAVANSSLTIEAIAREGTLQRARYLNSIAESQAKLESMSTDDVKKATFKGVSRHRISQAVEQIREHNDQQTEKKNKVCITRGIVFKITGSNRSNINKFFDEYEVMIDDHNHKHELTDADNRKGKGFDLNQLLGIA